MKTKTSDPFFASLRDFTELTRQLIKVGDPGHLRACFVLVDKLFKEGEEIVKHALRSNYLPSLHAFLAECEFSNRITQLFPNLLRDEYERFLAESKIRSDYSVFVICLN